MGSDVCVCVFVIYVCACAESQFTANWHRLVGLVCLYGNSWRQRSGWKETRAAHFLLNLRFVHLICSEENRTVSPGCWDLICYIYFYRHISLLHINYLVNRVGVSNQLQTKLGLQLREPGIDELDNKISIKTLYVYIYFTTQVSIHTHVHDGVFYRTTRGLMEMPPGAIWGFSILPDDTSTCTAGFLVSDY